VQFIKQLSKPESSWSAAAEFKKKQLIKKISLKNFIATE
tara:strand:+ start:564 stop:680 length:117 start_codon:yes stop_codon:yes gene_type:complete